MDNKLILTDVDECILQWTEGFTNFICDHKDIKVSKERDDHRVYKWLEIHDDEAYKLVMEFNSSNYFSLLEPFACAQQVLPKLYTEGYRFVAITSCSSDSIISKMRRENLQKYFGNIFKEVHCLDFGDDKGEILLQYPKAIWVEDAMEWAVRGADLGHSTFLISHKHNETLVDPRIVRVNNWHTLYNIIHSFTSEPEIPQGLEVVSTEE